MQLEIAGGLSRKGLKCQDKSDQSEGKDKSLAIFMLRK